MSADRNLLFGILALQLDFVGRDQLITAMNAWVLDKSQPLGDVLRRQGVLDDATHAMLNNVVEKHIGNHGGDAQRSIAALSSLDSGTRQKLNAIADHEVQATMMQIGATHTSDDNDPLATRNFVSEASPGVRYRILRPHARGGLGEVFVAEDTELGRRVALKEIQPRHADDAASRGRFVLEAEITGGLEHPGIVPVYGLGSYADGRPYYAMRFIQGENLGEAIRRFHGEPRTERSAESGSADAPHAGVSGSFDSLEFREILQRFIDVCNAVAYAHSRGVLHRDLKPGNIMLGRYGETLVVDWGLAKLTVSPTRISPQSEQGLTDEAVLAPRSRGDSSATIAGSAMGTPAYMPPEQAAGQSDMLGPASDVYSLGATLYELLTGRAPFQNKLVQIMLDDVRAGRLSAPHRWNPDVPRALEAVCLKAMALNPADRYSSPLELAKEIERWLADEPVSADTEPFSFRARRWARKHSRLTTGLAATLLVGAIGSGALAWQRENARQAVEKEQIATAKERDRANDERDIAREQKRRTRAALDTMVSKDMIERLGSQKELTKGQKEFLQTAFNYYREFAAEAATDEEGRKLEAGAHFRIAYLFQVLGQREDAIAAYRVAIPIYERLAADHPAATEYRQQLSRSYGNLGVLLKELGRRADAEAAYRNELAIEEKLAADFPALTEYRQDLAGSHNNLGNLLFDLGRQADAEAAHRTGLAIKEKLAADFPAVPAFRHELALSQNNLAVLLSDLGRRADAENGYRTALRIGERLIADFPATPEYREGVASIYNNLSRVLHESGREADAEAASRTALAIHEKLVADFPAVPEHRIQLGGNYGNLGNFLYDGGKFSAAVELHSKAIAVLSPIVAAEPRLVGARQGLRNSHWGRADDYIKLKRPEEALTDFERALELDDGSKRAQIRLGRAGCLARLGRLPEAVRESGEVAADPTSNPEVLYLCAGVFAIAGAAPNNPNAEAHATRAVKLLAQAIAKGYKDVEEMKKDADLDSLRQREDFKKLISDLAAAQIKSSQSDATKPAEKPKP